MNKDSYVKSPGKIFRFTRQAIFQSKRQFQKGKNNRRTKIDIFFCKKNSSNFFFGMAQ